MDQVLLAGGAGYVGSAVARYLAEQGYGITILDRLVYGGEAPAELADDDRIRIVQEDFRDSGTLQLLLRSVDHVVHLGGFVGEPACDLDPQLTLEHNLAAPLLCADLARTAGVRTFVFLSTCSVYGCQSDVADETTTPAPISLYAFTKVQAEQELARVAGPSFATVSLRCATAFGLSPRPRLDSVVNAMAVAATTTGTITVRGGSQWRPLVHVADIAAVVEWCLGGRRHPPRVLNVGSDRLNYRVHDIGELVQRAVPGSRLVVTPAPEDGRDYRVDFRRLDMTFGVWPFTTVEEGAAEVAAAVRSGGITDPGDIRYHNYRGLARAIRQGTIGPWTGPVLQRYLPAELPPLEVFGPRAEAVAV